MNKRTITQVEVFELFLNPMRGHTEDRSLVVVAFSKEKLIEFYEGEIVEEYEEVGNPSFECQSENYEWHKMFRKGGPLEWYNRMINKNQIKSEWIDEEHIEQEKNNCLYNGITWIDE